MRITFFAEHWKQSESWTYRTGDFSEVNPAVIAGMAATITGWKEDKAAELHLKRKEVRHRSREEAQEIIQREQLREKAYESMLSLQI